MPYADQERQREAQRRYVNGCRARWLAKQPCRRCGELKPGRRVFRMLQGAPKPSWSRRGPSNPEDLTVGRGLMAEETWLERSKALRAAQAREIEARAKTVAASPTGQLAAEERRIQDGLEAGRRAFLAIGAALKVIRDKRLYLVTHETFEAYCEERLKFGRSHVNRMIQGAVVVQNLLAPGDESGVLASVDAKPPEAPANVAQTRELAKVPPKDQPAVWRKAVGAAQAIGKPVSAARIKEARTGTVSQRRRAGGERCPMCQGTGRLLPGVSTDPQR